MLGGKARWRYLPRLELTGRISCTLVEWLGALPACSHQRAVFKHRVPPCLPACGESGLTAGPDSPNPDSSTPRPTSRTLTGVRESENQLWAAGFSMRQICPHAVRLRAGILAGACVPSGLSLLHPWALFTHPPTFLCGLWGAARGGQTFKPRRVSAAPCPATET